MAASKLITILIVTSGAAPTEQKRQVDLWYSGIDLTWLAISILFSIKTNLIKTL